MILYVNFRLLNLAFSAHRTATRFSNSRVKDIQRHVFQAKELWV